MPNFNYKNGVQHTDEDIAELYAKYPHKFLWFARNGYTPHYWQVLFHGNTNPEEDHLTRFRHLVAGRRGGKTLSAAWETVFYALHPEIFHRDAHGKDSKDPLHIWVVTKDYPTGLPALLALRNVLEAAGLTHGVEFKENRGNRWFEFENGTFLQFKTADDPESLRGAGLDILWMDEAAFITGPRAWEVVRPALSNKLGLVYTTTTPDGKNWFYDEFWNPQTMESPNTGRVEYRSIDNPHFPSVEWKEVQRTMHPMLFKQEYLAAFDSMAGKDLAGDWLHYYNLKDLEHLKREDGSYDLDTYIGVDPAISLADTADRFAITVIGVSKDRHQIYLLDQWAGRIPFPEQVDKIYEWHQKWRPRYIAIERVAYQAALVQQIARLPNFPPVVPYWPKGKKFERILSMAPLFRISKILIRRDHVDFINEWVDYDSSLRNPKDDCLDSFEIALRGAGVLLPGLGPSIEAPMLEIESASTASDWSEIARKRYAAVTNEDQREAGNDYHLGHEW